MQGQGQGGITTEEERSKEVGKKNTLKIECLQKSTLQRKVRGGSGRKEFHVTGIKQGEAIVVPTSQNLVRSTSRAATSKDSQRQCRGNKHGLMLTGNESRLVCGGDPRRKSTLELRTRGERSVWKKLIWEGDGLLGEKEVGFK